MTPLQPAPGVQPELGIQPAPPPKLGVRTALPPKPGARAAPPRGSSVWTTIALRKAAP